MVLILPGMLAVITKATAQMRTAGQTAGLKHARAGQLTSPGSDDKGQIETDLISLMNENNGRQALSTLTGGVLSAAAPFRLTGIVRNR